MTSRCSNVSSRSVAVSKDKARALQGKQESIGKLGKRIQVLLKKQPSEALALAKELYRQFRTHEVDSESLISAVKKLEEAMGPFVPKLNMRDTKQNQRHHQGRGNVWTTEGGMVVQEQSSRQNDNTARHEACRATRRARQSSRQMNEQSRRANARQRQRAASKLPTFEEDDRDDDQENDARYRRLKNLQNKRKDVWYRKAEMEADIAQKEKHNQVLKDKEERRQTKGILEAQMKQKQDATDRRRSEREAYEANVLADVENHKKEQQEHFYEEAQKAQKQADAQLAQRLARRRERDNAKSSKMKDGQQLLKNIELQQKNDKIKEVEQQRKDRAAMKKVKQENVKQTELTKQNMAREKSNDVLLQKQYEKMEQQREMKRDAHTKKMQNDVKAKMARFDHMKQEEDNLAADNEKRAAKEEKAMQRRQHLEEKRRAFKREERTREQQEVLKAQLQEKRIRAEREKAEDKQYASQWKREEVAKNKQESDVKRKKQLQAKKQQHWLKQQIDMRQQMQDDNVMGMTPRERAMNQKLLVKLGCNEIADKTRSRAQQVEQQQRDLEQRMMNRPAGMPSHRNPRN